MLKGIVFAIAIAAAYGCMYIIYGKEGMKQRQVQGKNNLFILAGLMLLLIFWSLSLLFLISGIAASDTAICVIVVFGVPVLVAILAVRTRRKINDQRADDSYMQIKGGIDICDEQKGDEELSE